MICWYSCLSGQSAYDVHGLVWSDYHLIISSLKCRLFTHVAKSAICDFLIVNLDTELCVLLTVRYQPVSPPPTKRIKHERSQVGGSGRGPGHSGRVKPEAALGAAWRHAGRASTPRSVIVISDTEDDTTETVKTLWVLSLLWAFIVTCCMCYISRLWLHTVVQQKVKSGTWHDRSVSWLPACRSQPRL